RLPIEVRCDKLRGFLDHASVLGHGAAAAALLDVERREAEPVDVEGPVVNDHHLAVVANEIVRGARDGDAPFEQLHLELPQCLCAAPVRVCGQGADADTAPHGGLELAGDVPAVEPEDEQIYVLPSFSYRLQD